MTIAETLEKRGEKRGLKKGMEKGAEKSKLEMAKSLLMLGKLTVEDIARVSQLSVEKVESLKTIH